MRITVRLSREDAQKINEIAEQRGMTTSDLVRDMIRAGYERQSVAAALRELRIVASSLVSPKGGSGQSEDIVEIRRIVTLMARAMPAVAKHVP